MDHFRRQYSVLSDARDGTQGAAGDYSVDLREVLRKLWRRKLVIVATVVSAVVVAGVILTQIVPRYTARALLMIESRDTNVVDIQAVMVGLPIDAEAVRSEIEVIRSRGLAEKVIDRLDLDRDPEFNEALRQRGLIAQLLDPATYLPEAWLAVVGAGDTDAYLTDAERTARARARIVNAFLDRLEVTRLGRSRVVAVAFESQSPQVAAVVANTLAERYILEQLEAKFEATQRVTAWLNERIDTLRETVEASERLVEGFRNQSGLIQGQDTTLARQQISELSTQLILARTARAESEARFRQVQELLASGGIESALEVLESPLIQRLREQESDVRRKAAELSTEFGEKHPRMINARAEARDLRANIETEVSKIVKGYDNEADIARAREESLNRSLDELKVQAAEANKHEIRLRALEREATANRTLLETFLARFKETSAQEDIDIQQPDARVISRADVADKPSSPRSRIVLAVVLVGSILLGVLLVFVIEHLDRGFRSGEQLEQETGVGVLALVPALKGLGRAARDPASHALQRPGSAYGESIRSLYTSVQLSHVDAPPRKILIASSLPKEGKTALVGSLGRMQAATGKSVVMIDADLRRPSLHALLGLRDQPGVVELLAGEVELEDVLQTDTASGAHFIAAGRAAPSPPDLVGSDRMIALLDRLAESHELVIIDSPPVMAVSDARILSKQVDATVFVVRWADTRREVVTNALRQMARAGGPMAGVVLSMVDARKHAQYGYGDSGTYYGPLKKYYTG